MANQVTNYKCPACTGPLRFDSATGKLQCDFCGSSYEVAEIEKLYAEKDAQAAGAFRQAEEQAAADGEWASASGSDWGADAEKLRVYSCPSCGAELICDETTSATSCPYCGNNTIVPGQFSGALKPDYVLPFKLDRPPRSRRSKSTTAARSCCRRRSPMRTTSRRSRASTSPSGSTTAARRSTSAATAPR